jgi:hypothetical protein
MAWKSAGRPSGELAKRATVADCFKIGRRRLNTDLVTGVVQALHPDVAYVTRVAAGTPSDRRGDPGGGAGRVQDTLPQDPAGFIAAASSSTGSRRALHQGRRDGGAVVISAIAGMAGVGKTQLAIHAGHLLARKSRLTGSCSSTCAVSNPTPPSRRPTRSPSWMGSCACWVYPAAGPAWPARPYCRLSCTPRR